jgi:putative hydrolase of HD superfamily
MVDLLHALETLKHLPRTGWLLRGVRAGESIADHSFRTAFAAMLLADALRAQGYPLDPGRVVRLALLHEIAECRTGDIPAAAASHLPAGAKSIAEADVTARLLAPLGPLGDDYLALWKEYEAAATAESIVARIADRMELLAQASEYEQAGARGLDDFWENADYFAHAGAYPLVRDILDVLRRRRSQNRMG